MLFRSLLKLLGDVPLLVTDSPAIHAGKWATGQMMAPERIAAWNTQVHRWVGSSSQVRVVSYAAPLDAYEQQHGSIRSDGVHPDVKPLTDLARRELLPALRHALDNRPRRLLVIGDSTSLMLAKALNDGSASTLTVQWAGQEGCPLVPVDAVRSDRKSTRLNSSH